MKVRKVGRRAEKNNDNIINVLDVILVVNFIMDISTPNNQEELLSDINQDSIINIQDIILIANHILEINTLEGQALSNADVNEYKSTYPDDPKSSIKIVEFYLSNFDVVVYLLMFFSDLFADLVF